MPLWIKTEVAEYLNTLIKDYPNLIEVVQHGLRHKSYAVTEGEKNFEFGFQRNYAEQRQEIQEGRLLLQKLFPVGLTPSFTPPWDVLNQDTVNALVANGIISSTGNKYTFENIVVPEGFTAVSCDYDTSIRVSKTRVQRDVNEVICAIKECSHDTLGVVMHGKELGSVETTITLLHALKALENCGFKFCLVRDLSDDQPPSLDRDRLAAHMSDSQHVLSPKCG